MYNLDIFFNSYCFFFFFPLNRDMGCGAVFGSRTLQLGLLNHFDFILSSIFPVADLVGGSTVEVGSGMERLMVMKGLLIFILLFALSPFSFFAYPLFLSCFSLFSVLVLFSIPGAPLSFNVIE